MEVVVLKLFLSCLLLTLLSSPNDACCANACKKIKASNPNAPSGTYTITPQSKNAVEVYCEMGLNGGGYTFLSPMALSKLNRFDLAEMFTDRSAFLMRIRRTDGTQPYAVLSQLPKYSSIPLKLGLSENTGYNAPVNIKNLGSPFLYFGFIPIVNGSNLDVQGLLMNGVPVTFKNCDRNPNSHITIFPDFSESVPSTYRVAGPVYGPIFSSVRPNPSGRVMPPEYFMFAESHWGGCGCYVQTNQVPGVLGLSIGFK